MCHPQADAREDCDKTQKATDEMSRTLYSVNVMLVI